MIRPEPSVPDRNDLVHQLMPEDWRNSVEKASFLPWFLSKGGRKTADESRELARNLANEGATQKEIYDETKAGMGEGETGMFQNPAGQFTFELSDKDARLSPEALEWLSDRMAGGYGGDTPEVDLNRLLQHESLYERDPGIGKVKTSLIQPYKDDIGTAAGGGYSNPETPGGKGTQLGRIQATGRGELDPTADDPWSLTGVLGHEIQHPLQYKHGLPQGGNENDPWMQSFFRQEMQPQADKARILAAQERERFAKEYAGSDDPERLRLGRELWRMEKPDQATILDQAEHVGGRPGQFARAGQPAVGRKPALSYFDQYRSLAGEQSATAAGERWNWDVERRQAEPSFLAEGTDKLAPAFQMLKFGKDRFELPDLRWGLANTMTKRAQ